MCADYLAPKPIAWNPTRMLWETDQVDLFSGLSEPYSETFPTSGMTRNGRLLPLPALAPATDESGSLSSQLLPTPSVADAEGTHERRGGGRGGELLLPGVAKAATEGTLSVESWEARRDRVKALGVNGNGMGTPLPIAVQLLPTPRATDGTKGGPNQRGSSGDMMLPSVVHHLTD